MFRSGHVQKYASRATSFAYSSVNLMRVSGPVRRALAHPGDTATVCSASIYPTPWTLLASEIHLHLRGLVFNGLAGNVHQRFLHCAGKCERRLVVGHHRRTCIAADANAPSQAYRQRYGHRQIAAPDRGTIEKQGDLCWHSLALGDVGFAGRRELTTEDVIALGNRFVGLHLEVLLSDIVVAVGQLAALDIEAETAVNAAI